MTKILHYIGGVSFGGSQSFVMELYRKMDRSQLQFDFVVFPNEAGGIEDEIKTLGGKIFVCPRYSGKNHFEFCKWWKDFLRDHPEYHVVHGHVRSCASIYLAIAKKAGLVTIAHGHSTSNGRGVSAVFKAILQLPIRHIAHHLFSCSDIAGEWLYGKRAVNSPKYKMVPNCVEIDRFAYSEQDRAMVRNELNISEDALVIGHIGRFHEAKNHQRIIEIFANVLKRRDDARLLLVGDGELRSEMERLCQLLGVYEKTIFAGAQANPARFYSAMDVFLFPSKWEGLPLSVVEAQAAGLPCFVSDTVTRNVKLTDLVTYYSLTLSDDEWADRLLSSARSLERELTTEQQEGLESFDSKRVAKELQEFYLSM